MLKQHIYIFTTLYFPVIILFLSHKAHVARVLTGHLDGLSVWDAF